MIDKVLEYSDYHNMLPDSGIVLVCVSGGADSMCLLEVMRHISYERGFSVAVAHFNHKLRGAESDRDMNFVSEYCNQCGVSFYLGEGDVAAYAKNNGLSIEEAARDLRYDFFYDLAENIGAQRIATAHNADDNTETIIINLTRGAGANGLSGIPPVREQVIRPMLGVPRDEIIEFLSERGISFVEDSTNAIDIYTRNKVRHHVIPILKELNPRLNEAAATTVELMRADEEMLSDLADLFISDLCIGLMANTEDLLNLPFSVSSRVIRKLYGGNLSFRHVKSVLELCGNSNPSSKISLPKMIVYKDYDRIVFEPQQEARLEGFAQLFPSDGDSAIILSAGLKMSCKSVVFSEEMVNFNKTFTTFLFKSIDIYGKITVRPRREGDKLRLIGQDVTKTLKKLFIERRIPARKRSFVPVIADSKGVLAVYGLGRSERAVPVSGDMALQIDFEEINPN
ncbi:MAG: tRNA lysidine(34) synthetase TilS [Oscillospiraceae bacterium]|nr:tRNA lysidine(34) synthetase TilS [Oscillospiraceae bacterium]